MSSYFSAKFKTRKRPMQPGQTASVTHRALCCHTSSSHAYICPAALALAQPRSPTAGLRTATLTLPNSTEKSKSVNFSVITPVKVTHCQNLSQIKLWEVCGLTLSPFLSKVF